MKNPNLWSQVRDNHFALVSQHNWGLWFSDHGSVVLKWMPPKAIWKIKSVSTNKKGKKKVWCCSLSVLLHLFSLVSCVLMSLHAFHSVRNGECIYLYEHHIKPNRSKRTFATLFATCMSGGTVPEREVHHQVTYRCHLSCQAQGFPWNGGKETGWKHLY